MTLLRQRIMDASKEHAPAVPEPVATPESDATIARNKALRPEPAPEPPTPRDRLPADVHEKVHKQIVRDLGPLASQPSALPGGGGAVREA